GQASMVNSGYTTNPGAVQRYATFIKLDAPAIIASENMSLINPKPVEWDGQWFNYVTSVPMKFGNCYLLDDSIPTPENVPDAKTHIRGNDLTGPPLGSKWYHMWNNESDKQIKSLQTLDYLTPLQLRNCTDKYVENIDNIQRGDSKRVCFILPLEKRRTL